MSHRIKGDPDAGRARGAMFWLAFEKAWIPAYAGMTLRRMRKFLKMDGCHSREGGNTCFCCRKNHQLTARKYSVAYSLLAGSPS
jgi:hypothetical protein